MLNKVLTAGLLCWHAIVHLCDFWQLPGPVEYDFLVRQDGSRSPALAASLQPLERAFFGLIGVLYGVVAVYFAAALVGAISLRQAAFVNTVVHGFCLLNLVYLYDQWTQIFYPGSFPVSYAAFVGLQVGPMLLSAPLLLATGPAEATKPKAA